MSNLTIHWLFKILLTLGFLSCYEARGDFKFLYVFNSNGQFNKIDISTNQAVIHGSLLEMTHLRAVLPEALREGCAPCQVRYDPELHRLYLLVSQDAFYSQDGTMRFRVVIIEVPEFKLVGRVDLAESVEVLPNILVTPDGTGLLVSFEVPSKGDHWVFVQEVYDTKKLERVEVKRERVVREPFDPQALAKARFSEKAQFAPDGVTIIDGEYEIVNEQARRRLLTPLPEEVERYLKYVEGRPYFLPRRLDEAGRRVLLWEVQKGGDQSTGRFALYDALATKKVREFYLKELEGHYPKVVATRPDGQAVYFAVEKESGKEELYAVDVSKDMTATRIELLRIAPLNAHYVFADR